MIEGDIAARSIATAVGDGRLVTAAAAVALAALVLAVPRSEGAAAPEISATPRATWVAAATADLPGALRDGLRSIALRRGAADARLVSAALLLLDSGFAADSLRWSGGSLEIAGLRATPLRLSAVESRAGPAPWAEGDLLGAPAEAAREARDWLAEVDRAGHPFAQLWLSPGEGQAPGDTIAVEALLVPGPAGPLGELRFDGLKRLRAGFLAELVRLDAEQPMSLHAARAGRARLAATGWFASLDEPLLGWDPVAGRVGVLYRVRERSRPNSVTAILGGGSGETSGALDLDLFSPFGAGRRWRFRADWQGRERSRLDVVLGEPRVPLLGVAADLRFQRVRQDSTFLSQSAQLDLRLQLPAGWTGIAGFGYERSLFPGMQTEMSRRRHRFGIAWRSLDPGWAGQRAFDLNGDLLLKRSSLPGEPAEESQWEGRGLGVWTQRLAGAWKLRGRAGGSVLLADEGRGFNVAELFPLGGALTLRGWDEEHFRGDRIYHGAAELALGDPLEVFAFVDYGWGRWRPAGRQDQRFDGWGTGLGLLAPAPRGHLALALALGEEKAIGGMRVHLSLVTGF